MSSLDEYQARYIDELIAASEILESIEEAAQAEAWVSGAIAEWESLDGADGGLVPAIRTGAPMAASLIEWMQGGTVPDGDAPWLADLGRHRVGRVLRLASSENLDEVGLIFEYTLDGEHDHDISVSIVEGALCGIAIGPAGLADGASTDDERVLELSPIDTGTAAELLSQALAGSLDQLSPSSEANVPMLLARFGAELGPSARTTENRGMPDRDPDDDAWCVGVVRSALRSTLDSNAPQAVEAARLGFAALVTERNPDALTVLEVAGVSLEAEDNAIDLDTLLRCVGGYFKPSDLSAHTDAQFDALIELEPVDWAGVVLGLTRAKQSHIPIDGATFVQFINRAPEITSTIPSSDAPRLSWTFEQMLFAWEATGVIDAAGGVSEAGRWLLPHAYVTALSDE